MELSPVEWRAYVPHCTYPSQGLHGAPKFDNWTEWIVHDAHTGDLLFHRKFPHLSDIGNLAVPALPDGTQHRPVFVTVVHNSPAEASAVSPEKRRRYARRLYDDAVEEERRQIPGKIRLGEARRQAKLQRLGPYAGGQKRAQGILREMAQAYEPEPVQPDTSPVVGEVQPDQASAVPGEEQAPATAASPDALPAAGRKKRKMHKDDLSEWPTDLFSHLTGEDIPDVVDDDLLLEEELSPAARVCSPLGRRLVRNAH